MHLFLNGHAYNIAEQSRRKEINFKKAIQCNANGLEQYQKGNYPAAIQSFTDGMQFDKESVSLLFNRAMGYIKSKQLPLAMTDIQQVLKIEPEHEKAKNAKKWLQDKGVIVENMEESLSDEDNYSPCCILF